MRDILLCLNIAYFYNKVVKNIFIFLFYCCVVTIFGYSLYGGLYTPTHVHNILVKFSLLNMALYSRNRGKFGQAGGRHRNKRKKTRESAGIS